MKLNEIFLPEISTALVSPEGAWVYSSGKNEPTIDVHVSQISVNEPLEKTAADTASEESGKTVAYFVRLLKRRQPVEPVLVKRLGHSSFLLVDGHHRLEAYKRLRMKSIPVRVLAPKNVKMVEAVEQNRIRDIAISVRKELEEYWGNESFWSVGQCLDAAKQVVTNKNDPCYRVVSKSIKESVDPKSKYRQGFCDVMALALHSITKLPLGLWRGYYPDEFGDEGDEGYQDAHAVVVVSFDPPKWIDVDGIHDGVPSNLNFTEPVTRVELVPASKKDVASAFTAEHLDRKAVEAAKTFVLNDPKLKYIMKQQIKENDTLPLLAASPLITK
jgi:hypothetical protein